MPLRIQNESFWEISKAFVLDSHFRFGNRAPVTKFVYCPVEEVLVLGGGRETPSHKALMSAYRSKDLTDTADWVRGILLRERKVVYYRQGVRDPSWYELTTEMLKVHGLPANYSVCWGPDAKRDLKEDLDGFP